MSIEYAFYLKKIENQRFIIRKRSMYNKIHALTLVIQLPLLRKFESDVKG